ncbi:MAG: hypothetical protein K0R65_1124 [Crocinitomicaceae bacterium]|jgi:hypothetical protein|nr:hypothetical protein [Crocinitomicaceae bacterium]
MNKSTFLFASLLALAACSGEEKNSEEVVSSVAAGGQTEAEMKQELAEFEKQEKERIRMEKESSTSLEFDKLRHDFGNVKPDSENLCKFKVKNTGKNPLIIESVTASCGCTTPHKPEKPIPPGEFDYIEVGFHPKPGQLNEIIKTVTVVANTIPKSSEISIRAYVK